MTVGLFLRHVEQVCAVLLVFFAMLPVRLVPVPSVVVVPAAGWGHHVDAAEAVAWGSGADGAGGGCGVPGRVAGDPGPG
jgi:hypothetical protein